MLWNKRCSKSRVRSSIERSPMNVFHHHSNRIHALSVMLFIVLAFCSNASLASPSGGRPSLGPNQPRQLSLADRIAYQKAIEEVLWRNRMWPEVNPNTKPSLDEIMSQADIEEKVNDYLRNSQA